MTAPQWATHAPLSTPVHLNFSASRLPPELAGEWAAIARDPHNPAWGGMLNPVDPTLAKRGSVKGLALYDQVLQDSRAKSLLAKRVGAVVAREWRVDAGGTRRADKQAAELVTTVLAEVGLDQLTRDLLGALLKGFAVAEVMWERRGDLLVPTSIRPRNPARFGFDEAGELRLRDDGSLRGEALPLRKFLVHTHDPQYGDPYGLGLGSVLWWLCFFKRQTLTFWLTFADRFASPTVVGRYPTGTPTEEQATLLRAARAAGRDAAVVFPEGMALDLLEAARSGGGDVYERLCRYLDEQMAVLVLGETLTTSAGDAGSRALGTVHNDVRLELAKGDADLLSATLNASLVRWLVDLNLPGAAYPTLWRSFEEPEDLVQRAERDTKVHSLGYRPSQAYMDETYGPGWEPDGPGAATTPDTPSLAPQDFAEADELDDLVDVLAVRGAAEGTKVLAEWVDVVERKSQEATTLESLRSSLRGLLYKLNPTPLANSLRDASLAAHLGGRQEVNDGR